MPEGIDLARLKELAEKATPGPWGSISDDGLCAVDANFLLHKNDPANWRYCLAVSPDVVMALIARIEDLEAKLQIAVVGTLYDVFLDMLVKLPNSLKDKVAQLTQEKECLENEANWLAEQLLCCTDDNRVDTCQYVNCRHLCANTTVQGWRKAAREAVKDN